MSNNHPIPSDVLTQSPNYVMNARGEPQAVLLDIATWKKIMLLLEEVDDHYILQQAREDLQILAKGQ